MSTTDTCSWASADEPGPYCQPLPTVTPFTPHAQAVRPPGHQLAISEAAAIATAGCGKANELAEVLELLFTTANNNSSRWFYSRSSKDSQLGEGEPLGCLAWQSSLARGCPHAICPYRCIG